MGDEAVVKSKTVRATGGASIVKRGDKFYVRFRDEDGVRRMRLAGASAAEAKAVAAEETAEVERRIQAKREGKIVGATPLRFDEFALDFMGVLKTTMRPATMRVVGTQVIAFGAFLKKRGDPTVDKVTRADVDAYFAAETARGCAQSYLSRQAWVLGTLWKGAIERGLATQNPFAKRRYNRTAKLEVPYLTPSQIDAVIEKVRPVHRDMIALLAATGMRVGEAIGLAWKDVDDLDGPRPQINVTRQGAERALLKTNAARRAIPMSERAREILLRRRGAAVEGVERIFHEAHTAQYVLRSLDMACEEAKIPHLRVHDLRHLFASHLVQAGVPTSTVARLLGHADGGALVSKRYGRWQPQDAEALAMARLAAFRASTPNEAK